MAQSLQPASAIATAAILVLGSSPVAATTPLDVLTTGSLIGARPAPAGRGSPDQDGTSRSVTLVRSALGPDLCVTLRLPGAWKVEQPEPGRINAIEPEQGAEIGIVAHTDADFAPGPGMLIERAASKLQREYERLLGKPAQVTTLEPSSLSPARRWTATWIDGNFAPDDRVFSLEQFLIEPAANRIVAITVSPGRGGRGEVVGMALETLTIQSASACPP
jgi:hypothetical protein